jgi:hypothetical protein
MAFREIFSVINNYTIFEFVRKGVEWGGGMGKMNDSKKNVKQRRNGI